MKDPPGWWQTKKTHFTISTKESKKRISQGVNIRRIPGPNCLQSIIVVHRQQQRQQCPEVFKFRPPKKNSKARSRKNIFAQKNVSVEIVSEEKKSDVTFFENFEFLENIEAPKKLHV